MLPNTFTIAFAEQLGILFFCGFSLWSIRQAAVTNDKIADVLENGWGAIPKASCGKFDAQTIIFWSSTQIFTFWFVSLLFTLYDKYNEMNHSLIIKKVYNPGRRQMTKIQWNMVRLANYESFKNTILSVICQLILYLPLFEWRGVCDSMWFENFETKYDWIMFFIKLALISHIADIIFYVGHRMFHESKYLYQNFHKLHHQWVDTYAVAATAAHPFEHFVSNLPTVLGPPIILGLPYGISTLFVMIATIHTCIQHSGYRIIIKINFDSIKFSKKIINNIMNLVKWKKNNDNNDETESDSDDDNDTVETNNDNNNNNNNNNNDNNKRKEELISKFSGMYDFHHDFHHHYQNAEYGVGGICDKFFKTRMKDQFPKAWKKIVKNCYDNGYIIVGVTNDDLISIINENNENKSKNENGKAKYESKNNDSSDDDNDDDYGDDDNGGETREEKLKQENDKSEKQKKKKFENDKTKNVRKRGNLLGNN